MGSTALHYAYLFEQEDCVALLIQAGAERFCLDDLGRSPSDLDPSPRAQSHASNSIADGGCIDRSSPAEYGFKIPGSHEDPLEDDESKTLPIK